MFTRKRTNPDPLSIPLTVGRFGSSTCIAAADLSGAPASEKQWNPGTLEVHFRGAAANKSIVRSGWGITLPMRFLTRRKLDDAQTEFRWPMATLARVWAFLARYTTTMYLEREGPAAGYEESVRLV
jgi:hypothetical protein